jgi:glycerol kinase
MSRYVLGIDEGGTGVRAHLYDHEARQTAASYAEIGLSYPRAGWVEHDPVALWEQTLAVTRAALADGGIASGDLCGIGITNQRASAVVWRDDGRPVYPAIGWQDLRTVERCNEINRRGYSMSPLQSATKFAWILDAVPGARADADAGRLRFGTIDTWIAWKLSDGECYTTDASNASCTGLYDFLTNRWEAPRCRSPRGLGTSKPRCSGSCAPNRG